MIPAGALIDSVTKAGFRGGGHLEGGSVNVDYGVMRLTPLDIGWHCVYFGHLAIRERHRGSRSQRVLLPGMVVYRGPGRLGPPTVGIVELGVSTCSTTDMEEQIDGQKRCQIQ